MIIKRRSFLKAASCLPLSLSIPSLVHSEINFGHTKITTVSDGSITLPASLTFDTMPKNELDLIINEFSLSQAAGGYLEEEQKLETVSREVEMLIESLNTKEKQNEDN